MKSNKYFKDCKGFITPIYESEKGDHFLGRLYKHIKFRLNDIVQKSNMHSLPKPKYNKKYKVAICAIFKNEASYLKEWIEFHRLVGFEHFYLFNNNSDDNFDEILQPYVQRNIVSLNNWDSQPAQPLVYKYWYEVYRDETQWCAFIDIDEFLFPTYKDSIVEWLKDYEQFPVILVYWLMFGTSGKLQLNDDELAIEEFCSCWNKQTTIGKVIYNTDFEITNFKKNMYHFLQVEKGGVALKPVNQYGYIVPNEKTHKKGTRPNTIQLNHYWSRSYSDFIKKMERGRAASKKNWMTEECLIVNERNNIARDYKIHRFLHELKIKLKEMH